MKNLMFKAASMTSFYSESQKPEFYTVLCKEKGSRKGWNYCGDGKGNVVKATSMKKARELSKKFTSDYAEKNSGVA
jgi:hypothetical protein